MSNITCARCGSAVHCLNSCTSAPPWCPVCGSDFQPAREAYVPRPIPAIPEPAADVVPLPVATPARAATAPAGAAPVARATVPLPDGVPAEVAARGDPEQVYATDEARSRRARCLAQLALGFLVVVLLAVAGLHLYHAARPLPDYDLSRTASRRVALGLSGLSLLLTIAGVLCTGTRWAWNLWGPRTYLVYPDVLVELRTTSHRMIPLEQVGAGERSTAAGWYRFPVAGGRAISFDETVHRAAALADAIVERAAQRRHWADFGDEATLAALRAATVGPSILTCVLGQPTLVYRITLLGDRLLFQCLAGAVLSDTPPNAPVNMGLAGGLIGGFNAWAHTVARQKTLAELARLEAADAPTLLELAQEKEGSFVAALPDVRALRLEPLSAVKNFFTSPRGIEQVCVLRMDHARQGRLALAMLSRDDVMTVIGPWAEVFGGVLTVGIAWSHSRCGFIAAP